MRRILREPLLHFLGLGAGLFVLFELVSGTRPQPAGTIVVGASEIARLAEGFTRTWQRPPSREELSRLVRDRVDEEVLYREALALGLDRDDTVVRRRLRQKLEFLLDADAPRAEPSEAELEEHRLAHRARFEEPPWLSLRQVYLKDGARSEAERLLARLRKSDAGWERAGDALSLPPSYGALGEAELSGLFGSEFAAAAFALPVGVWSGPLASGYGVHLVHVGERSEARLPPLAEIRDEVARDLEAMRRAETNVRRVAALREKYEVRVEWPESPAP